jgi:RNA polymerase sigma-70 factor (ECF subfamily)
LKIEQIWSQYRSSVKSFLHSRISNPAEVEDLLQEVLVKTYENLETVENQFSIKSWLFRIANNAIIDFYRRTGKSRNLSAEDLWYSAEDVDIKRELSNCIEPFISALPASTAEMLRAIDLEGKSQKAYAQELGISYSTLKSRVQNSRTQLRDLFGKCCHFSVDASGNLLDFDPKSNICKKC